MGRAMSWMTNLFSSGASKLVESVGAAADSLITSDEERLKLKNEMEGIVNNFKTAQLELLSKYDAEITARHSIDMKSDSWMSKNIRPLTLAFMVVSTMVLAYSTTFMLPPDKVEILTPWISLLTTLDVTMFSFYFGSRGLEKIAKSIKLGK
jgi:hypothetical protein